MNHETADVSELLDCLGERLPALRQALLADPQAQLDRVELTAGAGLLSKGEVATAVYVIASGLLRATATREDGTQLTLSEFGAGELAGEMAILTGVGVYSASVSAAQDSVLVRVPRSTFERIAKTAPQVVQEMSAAVWRRIARDQLALGLTRLFGPLQESVLRYVESRVQWVRLQAGETLFSAGDSGRDLYFVLERPAARPGARRQRAQRDDPRREHRRDRPAHRRAENGDGRGGTRQCAGARVA